MNRILAMAAPLAALALAGAAPLAAAKSPLEPQPDKKQCFNARMVNGFAAPDEHHLYVRVGVKDVYEFEMFGPCPDIDWNQRVGLISRGSSWICDKLDAEIVTKSAIGPQRCVVRNMRKLTPVEVAALPKNAKP